MLACDGQCMEPALPRCATRSEWPDGDAVADTAHNGYLVRINGSTGNALAGGGMSGMSRSITRGAKPCIAVPPANRGALQFQARGRGAPAPNESPLFERGNKAMDAPISSEVIRRSSCHQS